MTKLTLNLDNFDIESYIQEEILENLDGTEIDIDLSNFELTVDYEVNIDVKAVNLQVKGKGEKVEKQPNQPKTSY